MADDELSRIERDPNFQELVRTRTRFGWILSAVMLAIYLVFILLIAFDKPLMASKIAGGATSTGIVLGVLVILSAVVLTGIYVQRANSRFDALTRDLLKGLGR